MKTFWQKFGMLVLGSLVTIVLSAMSATYLANKTANSNILKNAAPVQYVDKKFEQAIQHSDKKDLELFLELDKKADQKTVEMIYEAVKKNSETNDKIYQYLLNQKNR